MCLITAKHNFAWRIVQAPSLQAFLRKSFSYGTADTNISVRYNALCQENSRICPKITLGINKLAKASSHDDRDLCDVCSLVEA